MNKWFKLIPISILLFILSLYILNFMPIIKSNCGCEYYYQNQNEERWVSLNYFVGCFCTAADVQPNNFPKLLKSNIAQGILITLPFILTALTPFVLRKRFD